MAGWLTDGVPVVQPITQNGTTVITGGISNNGTITGGSAVTYTNVGSSALVPLETQASGGAPPQTVAATAFQIACYAMGLIANQATSTVHAATLNTEEGFITTESLSTAAGATYTFTLTNSLISTANTPPSPAPQVQVHGITNTGGTPQITSVTNGVGSTVIVITNIGSTAFNGTLAIGFHT